jgi:two-component system, OmpR family, response regulator
VPAGPPVQTSEGVVAAPSQVNRIGIVPPSTNEPLLTESGVVRRALVRFATERLFEPKAVLAGEVLAVASAQIIAVIKAVEPSDLITITVRAVPQGNLSTAKKVQKFFSANLELCSLQCVHMIHRDSTPPMPATPVSKPSLLIVEDDDSIRDLLSSALRFAGYHTLAVASGSDGYSAAIAQQFDLLILDVGLPGINGIELCRLLRDRGDHTPIIFLTANREIDDMRAGFDGGGDDYITKPFSLDELTMRVNAVLRRTAVAGQHSPSVDSVSLRCGDLVINEVQHRVIHGEQTIQLTPTEFRLIVYLVLNHGAVVSKDQILEKVWGHDFEGDGRIVETYISSIRTKLNPDSTTSIHTVRGFGYSLRSVTANDK